MTPPRLRARTSTSSLLQVSDRAALARVIDDMARDRLPSKAPRAALSHNDVTKALGLSRATVQRLRTQKLPHITQVVADTLAGLAGMPNDKQPRGGRYWRALQDAIVSPAARQRLRSYHKWLEEQWWRHTAGARAKTKRKQRELALTLFIQPNLALYRRQGHNAVARFEKDMRERGIEEGRIRLATRRVFEPLAESLRSGGIERSWDDLSGAEKDEYVNAALTCQRILLNRPDALAVSQRIDEEELRQDQDDAERGYSLRSDVVLRNRQTS